ncbi:MAG: hypothetical protein ACR2P5_05480 [Gammaproteobacteria bacterium]
MEPDKTAWQYVLGAIVALALTLATVVRHVVTKHRRNGRLKERDQKFCVLLEKDIARLDGAMEALSKDVREAREHLAEIEGRLSK